MELGCELPNMETKKSDADQNTQDYFLKKFPNQTQFSIWRYFDQKSKKTIDY